MNTQRNGILSPVRPRRRVLLALAWYSLATHRGVVRYAHEAGWILDGGYVRGAIAPGRWRGDGVIAVFGMHDRLDEMLRQLRIPIVNIGYGTAGPQYPSVCADIAAVGTMAAEHFLSRGFRNVAYYQFHESPGDTMHRDAFFAACQARGVRPHVIGPVKRRLYDTGRTEADLYDYIAESLEQLPKPIGVFAEFDDRAIEVMDAAMLRGLRVPEQVAVLGADNDELRCPFAPVPLSSIDNDEERIGYEAGKLLNSLMEGRPAPDQPIRIAPRGVVVRQSTNILAIPHEYVARALRIIWEHYTESIDATDVASQIPMSYPQLHASFVKHVGHSMAEELTRRRVEHAQRLLGSPDIKMIEVARRAGFGSADRMGRVFIRKLGITPSDYRRETALHAAPAELMPEETELPAKPAKLVMVS